MEIPIALVDNMSAINFAKNPVFHQRTKHINIKHHVSREVVQNNIMTIEHVKTNNVLAERSTKALAAPKLNDHLKSWGTHISRADATENVTLE